MTEIWETVHQERAALARDLAGLPAESWTTPSLCAGWTVHDVLAHLVHDARTTKFSFAVELARARFNFDRANQMGVERERRATPSETLAAFEDAAPRTTSAPAPMASRFVEIIVHGEDIRRPLGIHHEYPTKAIIAALEYQLATAGSMGGSKERSAGLTLTATDSAWTTGSGPIVHGTGLDLLLALTGRAAGLDGLIGDGVEALSSRM